MSLLKNHISVYRISLYKKFRSQESSELPKASWYVFGHYDAMNIVPISWSSYINPLEAVYQDAEHVTDKNEGYVKEHVLYSLGFNKGKDRRFFGEARQHPLLLVSLIHLKHPFRTSTVFRSQSIHEIKSQIEKEFQSVSQISCLVNFSVDCNDLIVFWSGNSLKAIMQHISNISSKYKEYICEVFTIQSCNKRVFSQSESSLLTIWDNTENKLDAINILLQGTNHGDLIQKAHEIEESYSEQPDQNIPKISILSGRDDIALRFKDITIRQFIRIYDKFSPLSQILDSLNSRTIIEIPLSTLTQEDEQSSKRSLPGDVPRLLSTFKTTYKTLNRTERTRLIWATPLQELLIELSNIQVSNTAYDIFSQAAESQEHFISTLCRLLNDQKYRQILLNPESRTVQFIQRYIQGWSQLSFHAMHSEWQLTQTSDVNRLYLFPAKLNRIYCSFMKHSSSLLSNNHPTSPSSESALYNSCYFLTPKICSNAEFISIFRECGDVSTLILGEIPADLIFSPQILLPILIHEAGHYIGGTLRRRDKRYDCLLNSSIQFVLQTILRFEKLREYNTDQTPLICSLIDKWRDFLKARGRFLPKDTYGINVTAHIKTVLIETLLNEIHEVNRFALSAVEKSKHYQHLDRSSQVLKAVEIFRKDDISELINTGASSSLNEFVDQLITIYREAFCDLCMIKSLNMQCGDYLNVICRSYRMKVPFGPVEYGILQNMTCWERITSVIETVWCSTNSSDLLCEDFETLLQSSYCSSQDKKCIRALLSTLYTHKKTNMIGESKCTPNRYSRASLKVYLRYVSKELDSLIQNKLDDFNLLRSVYASLSHDAWIMDSSSGDQQKNAYNDLEKLIQITENNGQT